MHFTTLATGLALCTTGWAGYTLQDDYFAGGNFFDQFSFWDSNEEADPTRGCVDYQNERNATDRKLIENLDGGQIKMSADSTEKSSNGRASVRITSKNTYQSGLIIVDIEHMPFGCGTWPAFWTTGPNWPHEGEIDILEGVNVDSTNKYTLHTGPSCSSISQSPAQGQSKAFSGTIDSTDCDVSDGLDNTGCGIKTKDTKTYGQGFNDNKGGVFATNWNDDGISIYFFARGEIPSDIESGSPKPSTWGMPQAHFQGDCDFAESFKNQQIVFTNTFCGDWAGAPDVWSQSCAASTGKTCEEWVQNNPAGFQEAYWTVNALKVYQNDGSSSEPEPSAAPSASAPYSEPLAESTWAAPEPTSYAPKPTSYAPAPSAPAAEPSGWAPIVSSDGAVIPEPTEAPAPAPAPSSLAEDDDQGWGQPKPTWEGGNPWKDGNRGPPSWATLHENADGGWAVGTPAMERRHARHLAQHKRHVTGGKL